jgi:pre-mRNA-splicing factor ATP-dependent RNA helicase DHX16
MAAPRGPHRRGRRGNALRGSQAQHTVHIHPSSVLAKDDSPPAWLCFHELAFTTKEYMRQCFPIEPQWLVEIAPHYFNMKEVADARAVKMPKATGRATEDKRVGFAAILP